MKNKKVFIALFSILLSAAQGLNAFESQAYLDYLKGLLDWQAGDVPGAVAKFNSVVVNDPNAASVYGDLASACWQAGDKVNALDAAQKLSELYGDNLYTQLFLGSFYMMAGMSDAARDAWEKALKIDPNNETAILYLAAFYSSNNNFKAALEYWNKYILQKPRSAESYYQQALAFERLGQIDKASQSLEKTIELKPESSETYFALAQLYEKQGRLKDAIKECEGYLAKFPDNVTILLYLGGLYYQTKDYSSAKAAFKRADEINPDDATIILWLGMIAESNKDWQEAISYFELLRKKEETSSILARLSYYYSLNGQGSKAIKYLKKAVVLDPKNPDYYYLLALAYNDDKEYSDAEKNFRIALKLRPDSSDVYFHMGVMFDEEGKFDEAVSNLEKAVELDPKSARALNYLSYTYSERYMKLDRAGDLAQRAIAIDPENPAFIDSLGWAYFRQNKFEDAEKYLQSASEKVDDATILGHLGDAEAALKKNADAWQAYRNSLDLGPKNKAVKAKLKETEKSLTDPELAKAMILRLAKIYGKIKSLKFQFFVSGESGSYNFNFSGILTYLKPGLWKADVPAGIQNPEFSVTYSSGAIRVYPVALENNMPPEVRSFFNDRGISIGEFASDSAKVRIEKKYFVYESGGKALTVNRKTALAEELKIGDSVSLEFSDYELKEFLYLPKYIEFVAKNKLKAKMTINNPELDRPVDASAFAPSGTTSK